LPIPHGLRDALRRNRFRLAGIRRLQNAIVSARRKAHPADRHLHCPFARIVERALLANWVLSLDWAGRSLGEPRAKVQEGELTFDKKRKLVETLVSGIAVKTLGSRKQAEIEVAFRFDPDFERA